MDLQPRYARVIGAIILIIWTVMMYLGRNYNNIFYDSVMMVILSLIIIGIICKEEIKLWIKNHVM
jgi:hypothetical protein